MFRHTFGLIKQKDMSSNKVWLVTGASKGLGLSLVKQLLKAGHQVAATSRKKDDLIKAIGGANDQFLPLQVDLTSDAEVAEAIEAAFHVFSRLDVVVNNAGYGIGGSIEEVSDEETRQAFDVNVFGTLNVIRHVMPHLRAQGSGHIINISSIAGFTGNTGWAIYAGAKFAIIGLTEVLAQDVQSFGIKVTVVAPGAFRTSFLSEESLVLTKTPIEAYQDVRASHARYLKMDGAQVGDPEKAAAAMMQITSEAEPPLYLLLGTDAYDRAHNKLNVLSEAFAKTEKMTKSTGFDA